MAAREDISSHVRSLVWSGAFDAPEVAYSVIRQFGDLDDADKVWLLDLIQSEFETKRKAEESWPKVTDFDRLDGAFAMLEAQGIIALHRAGFDHSEGIEEVEEAHQESDDNRSDYVGYCFYTEQDQEGAMEGSGLYVSFGHLSENKSKFLKVGAMLCEALVRSGLKVDWDGTAESRVFIRNFCWQRRSPW